MGTGHIWGKRIDELTPRDVTDLEYVDFISLLEETNRCPGGIPSLRRQIVASGIDASCDVLEIGSNTGFTSLELVKMTRCSVTGIDPVASAVQEARRRQALLPSDLEARVRFEVGNARHLRWEKESFDVIVCGGANSFIDDRDAAFAEYARVLRPLGRVTITNFFYRETPSESLRARLQETIGVDIPAWSQRRWLREILDGASWEVLSLTTHGVVPRPAPVIDAYADYMVSHPRLRRMRPDTREAMRARWHATCSLFNENLAHLGFFELVLRRPIEGLEEQAALFLSPGEYDRWFEHDVIAPPDVSVDPWTRS